MHNLLNKKRFRINKLKLRKGGQNMMPLITIMLLMLSLIFVGVQHFAAQEFGGRSAMDSSVTTMNRDIPRIDIEPPAAIKTATFALG
ncbi:MAG TPA: hypothetical protein DDX85_01440 [Nitrospiraceae bacterium]|nr:hypothetical protein [Nitrospiraceae bacterium]